MSKIADLPAWSQLAVSRVSNQQYIHGFVYRVYHKSPMQRYMRESVMVFVKRVSGWNLTVWWLAPGAGVQVLPTEWIVSVNIIPHAASCFTNRLIAGL